MEIRTKRVYERATAEDGYRVLVDRLWPRGIKKAGAPWDDWLQDLAPSSDLRAWFKHEPRLWDEFKARYFAELDQRATAVAALRERATQGSVTLIYAAKDEQHNNALALREYLLRT